MTTFDDVLCLWRPSHLCYLGLCTVESALEMAEYDVCVGKSVPYPEEVSRT